MLSLDYCSDFLMQCLTTGFLGTPVWFWLVFVSTVVALLALDLGVLHKDNHEIGIAESFKLSAFYIVMGLLFGAFVWYERGDVVGMQYLTGFVVEKTLAMDNIFVIAMIFSYFSVPRRYQHRVLFWGILGVIFLRGIMIGLGAAAVSEFEWILYLFAVFLIVTGIKMIIASGDDAAPDLDNNWLLKQIRKRFNVTKEHHQERFFVRLKNPKTKRMELFITPMFLALILVEIADVIFAVDSIPAVFAITTDTFVVYTSNIFAILGLRALFFALSAMVDRFKYLKYALSVLLVFIGSKIFIADALSLEKFPPTLSLGITLAILTVGISYSWYRTRTKTAA